MEWFKKPDEIPEPAQRNQPAQINPIFSKNRISPDSQIWLSKMLKDCLPIDFQISRRLAGSLAEPS